MQSLAKGLRCASCSAVQYSNDLCLVIAFFGCIFRIFHFFPAISEIVFHCFFFVFHLPGSKECTTDYRGMQLNPPPPPPPHHPSAF